VREKLKYIMLSDMEGLQTGGVMLALMADKE